MSYFISDKAKLGENLALDKNVIIKNYVTISNVR